MMATAKKLTVLVVDCSDDARNFMRYMLSDQHDVVEATNAEEAIRQFQQRKPDCVMLDEGLPQMRNFDLMRSLIDSGAIVVVTSENGSNAVEREVIRLGSQDYAVRNRLNRAAINRILERAIERGRLMAETHDALHRLRESEQRFNEIASRITEGLWVRNDDGTRCLYLSPTFEQIWGRTLEEMNRLKWGDTIHPDDRDSAYEAFVEATRQKREYTLEYRVVRPDGTFRHVINQAFPVLDEDGNLLRQAGIVRDVTEERRREEERRVAQKLESVGQLSAGIAHEINTPSQYVSDNVSFLEDALAGIAPILRGIRDLLADVRASGAPVESLEPFEAIVEEADLDFLLEEMPGALRQARQGMDQISKIVGAMKEFTHVSADKEAVDLNQAMESTATVARNEWKYVADLEFDLDDSLPPVCCVRSAICQVVLNLVVNAAHAIEEAHPGEKGRITIRTRHEPPNVVFSVADTGSGIPDEIRERIFDPFFTTKEVGKGTGQGLAICHNVVREQHRGSISIDSAPGEGTCFTITLPMDGMKDQSEEAAA